MKPLYSENDYSNARSKDLLPLECYCCKNVYFKEKKFIKYSLKNSREQPKFCSRKCKDNYSNKSVSLECKNCGKNFIKARRNFKRTKNHFCSSSCNATYNNKNKTTGNRRSKLEIFLENQLDILYPELKIDYNKKTAIGSELDIYIPSLKLAFELNGIFHYEPIFGVDKLEKIKSNDESKFKLCIENNISLCLIDVSREKYFKEKNSFKYLDIITEIVNKRLLIS